jgi:hypothetical protein
MTRQNTPYDAYDDPNDETRDGLDVPLEPWMLDVVREASAELDQQVEVPRDMMWARIKRERSKERAASAGPVRMIRQFAAAAAVLVSGVAIGRYVVPSSGAPTAPALGMAAADSAIPRFGNDPSRVAMQEHLVRTVALLTSVGGDAPSRDAEADLGPLARDLLTTTRLLLDQPQLRDERTRRLLQDLELVLAQVIQARSTAPETQRAPRETMRETNLLTRVNALVTAASQVDAAIYGGD